MAISLVKEFRQKQKITLTPLLKKSIDLLQLSRYELIQKIDNEIDTNPFIEKEVSDEIDYDNTSVNDFDFDFNIAASENLKESLSNQINDLKLDIKTNKIAATIIASLDEAGQLCESLEDILEILNYQVDQKEVEDVLVEIIQDLEPPGVGYRDFKECIKIQINKKKLDPETKILCFEILYQNQSDNLQSIKNDLINLGHSESKIDNAITIIKSCDLSPGLNYEQTNFIIPDLKIRLDENSLSVDFLDQNFPKIIIDSELIEKSIHELKKNPNKEISEKIQDAKWLLSSVKKRNDTVRDVGELICKKQISFLEENPLKINPLTNKELSEELGIHPSTVSRILRSKYIDTPKGIIPLKSLPVSSVAQTRRVTPLQLLDLIDNLIKEEKNPKSDNKISLELNKKGFNLARRTITKYRKKLNIPSSRNR